MKQENKKHLVITTIADSENSVLQQYASEAESHGMDFIVIGDKKSPQSFKLSGCDYYSVERQEALGLKTTQFMPYNHYARKNIGYLVAVMNGSEIIVETDDDNLPMAEFWSERKRQVEAHQLVDCGWVNVYSYFTDKTIWPRGFSLEHIQRSVPGLEGKKSVDCVIQQGLATRNPDVDAMFRLTRALPFEFRSGDSVALGKNSICPFNSQNTTWFRDAFPLLYLPSFCSFRMTDIWRSFVAQRCAWECGWNILFHESTVWQERNDHNLLQDFKDEIPGYLHNNMILDELRKLTLREGTEYVFDNMRRCYQMLIDLNLIDQKEKPLLEAWGEDMASIG